MNDVAGQPPLDQIYIRELKFRCIIGTNVEERRERQDIVADVTLYADLQKACSSDALADTVDYKALKKRILGVVERSRFHLIEALAQNIADLCLEQAGVRAVRVLVEKPGALRFARTVGVEIVRRKDRTDE
jgi:FolB domain-containing protein